jgi:hypothetical protein
MRQRFRNKKKRARRVEEAPVRQAAYDALTPQQRFGRTVARSVAGLGASRRETGRILNGPGGEKVRTS